MNVGYSDNITNVTKSLRENVYYKDEFKNEFNKELKKNICATETTFVPEQFGGWSINVIVDREKCEKIGIDQTSSSYLNRISDALVSSLHSIYHSDSYESMANNLANVIVTGENSIVIKL